MKATHQGECQLCGRAQKLPSGNLSIHGYTTRWGFFSGTCGGSHHLPFEISKDLIEGAIANARQTLTETVGESARLKSGAQLPDGKVWDSVYKKNLGRHVWERVLLTGNRFDYADGTGFRMEYTTLADNGQSDRVRDCGSYTWKSLDEAKTAMNTQFAKETLDRKAAGLRDYIKWQTERVASWKPAALKAVTK